MLLSFTALFTFAYSWYSVFSFVNCSTIAIASASVCTVIPDLWLSIAPSGVWSLHQHLSTVQSNNPHTSSRYSRHAPGISAVVIPLNSVGSSLPLTPMHPRSKTVSIISMIIFFIFFITVLFFFTELCDILYCCVFCLF